MAFKMKGYSAYDKMDSAYDKHGMYKKMDSAYDKYGAYKQTDPKIESEKEKVKIPTKDGGSNAVTDANIARFSKDSGYSVATINSIIDELSDVGGGGMEDDFDMRDVINAVRNRFETNSDEVD